MDGQLRIQWIADGVRRDSAHAYSSALASNRYRVMAPCLALQRRAGVAAQLLAAQDWDARVQTNGHADIVIIGKVAPGGDPAHIHALSQHILDQVDWARAAGVKIVADFNDDHFDRPGIGPYWQGLARRADVCVAGTESMRDRLSEFTSAPVHVIGDPVLAPRRTARAFRCSGVLATAARRVMGSPSPRLRLLWYGNLNNWPALPSWAEALVPLSRAQPWLLRVVTSPFESTRQAIDEFNRRHAPGALMEFVPWSEGAQIELLEESHVVLLPSDPSDPSKRVKTANRLTDALQAGCYVVASALPSYRPYADAAMLTDDPLVSMRAYLDDPDTAIRRIELGQALIDTSASVDVSAGAWLLACRQACTAAPSRSLASTANRPEKFVRLNLGCGDKILEGYVNVDVVAARAGKVPDVMCDLRDLAPFTDASADEVMAIHVVEHFWRWEVEDVLREWLRVLKPGGRMILECPNLLSACQELLANPEQRARSDASGQRSMWVFYGDPAWKDPLMIHRWGYTPQSLGELMQTVGLVDVHQEPAQFKLREPRDMRLVGVKPVY